MSPLNNPVGALVYNAHPGLVDTILVAGRVVKRDGVLTHLDPKHVLELAHQTRDHVLEQARDDELIGDIELGGTWTPRNPAHAHSHA
jgi:5-methylthioadenosine/S-adenosylhomocysteine deaminase